MGRFLDLTRRLQRRLVQPPVGEKHLPVAEDGSEHVVEIVGHPSCKASHRLHLLRLPKLFFAALKTLICRFLGLDHRIGKFRDPPKLRIAQKGCVNGASFLAADSKKDRKRSRIGQSAVKEGAFRSIRT